jgi:hypothetical protein
MWFPWRINPVKKAIFAIGLLLIVGGSARAQGQLATVNSAAPFQLRGATVVPGQGVPSWPVMPGDEIVAGDAPVSVTFADGSNIVMGVSSEAVVDRAGQTPEFELLSGKAQYFLKSPSAVKVLRYGKPVDAKGQSGGTTSAQSKPTFTSAVHSGVFSEGGLIAIGAVAAGGAGYGIYEGLHGGSSVSPSK